jgi:hypothetical protein
VVAAALNVERTVTNHSTVPKEADPAVATNRVTSFIYISSEKNRRYVSDGGAGGCFNCGQSGHKSFDCPEPRKGRPAANGGGMKRSFTGNRDNGYGTNESTPKKIKFDDDDE